MTLEERKAKLVSAILGTQEDDLVRLLEEDVVAYKKQHVEENADGLSQEEVMELDQLMEEDAEKNTITLAAFQAKMEKWRNAS